MSLLSLISDDEKIMMKRYINWYAFGETDLKVEVEMDYLLREWDIQKSLYLSKPFGNSLILEKEIEFTKSKDILRKEVKNLLNKNFLSAIETQIWNRTNGHPYEYRHEIHRLTSDDCLSENIYHGSAFQIKIPGCDKSIKIQEGTKVTRALQKLAKELDIMDEYEEFRLAHSVIFNQKLLRGTLCLSIHPFDYMTMSDNASNWSSCMSWMEDGCYRHGTVEMMNSPMVVVAYLKTDKDKEYDFGIWNNKKWRELYVVTPEVITNVKSYPYKNDELTKYCLKWLKELYEDSKLSVYNNNITKWINEEPIEFEGRDFSIYFCSDYMYNDFDNTDYCLAYFGLETLASSQLHYDFNYSGSSECMSCGELDIECETEGFLFGTCCHRMAYCDICGDYHDADSLIEIDGYKVCSYCRDESFVTDIEGNLRLDSDCEKVHVYNDDLTKRYYQKIYIHDTYRPRDLDVLHNKYFKNFYYIRKEYSEFFFVKESDIKNSYVFDEFYDENECTLDVINNYEIIEVKAPSLYEFKRRVLWNRNDFKSENYKIYKYMPERENK